MYDDFIKLYDRDGVRGYVFGQDTNHPEVLITGAVDGEDRYDKAVEATKAAFEKKQVVDEFNFYKSIHMHDVARHIRRGGLVYGVATVMPGGSLMTMRFLTDEKAARRVVDGNVSEGRRTYMVRCGKSCEELCVFDPPGDMCTQPTPPTVETKHDGPDPDAVRVEVVDIDTLTGHGKSVRVYYYENAACQWCDKFNEDGSRHIVISRYHDVLRVVYDPTGIVKELWDGGKVIPVIK